MFIFFFLFFLSIQKNIIILICDGLGFEQMKFIEENGYPWTFFEGFSAIDTRNPYCGVPDSASSATAIFSGIFTENKMIGMAINGKEYETLGEIAKRKGYYVGVMTDVEIWDATPASLYAHTKDRNNKDEILKFLKKSKFDFFVGKSEKKIKNLKRINEKKDYTKILEEKILELKKIKKPYFLMIEFGRIDYFCHENNLKGLNEELKKLKKFIDFLIQFLLEEKNLILILTADHETGGFDFEGKKFKTKKHTTEPVPLFSNEKFPEFLINQPHLNKYILKILN